MDEDIWYVLLICAALFLGVCGYWGLSAIFAFVTEHLLLTLFGLGVLLVGSGLFVRRGLLVEGRRRRLLESLRAPVFDKYQELRRAIENCSSTKRAVLGEYLVPMLAELMEEKLPDLIGKRDEYAAFLAQRDLGSCEAEVRDLRAKIEAEEDADIRRALEKSLALSEGTLESYGAIAKTLKLYDIQIRSIEKHLENMRAKLQILEMDDEIKASTETILQEITADIEDLEHALLQAEPNP